MVRKGFCCGLSFMAGLFLAGCFSIKLWWVFALSAAALSVVGALCFRNIRRYFIVCGITFILGTVYNAAYTNFVYEDIISYDSSYIDFEGTVQDYNYQGHAQGYLTVKGKLAGHTTTISFLVDDDDYEYYDDVRVSGKVSVIKDNYNFRSQDYYKSEGVFLKGAGKADVSLLGTNSNGLFKAIRKYSDHVFSVVLFHSGYDEKGFLGAMLCGDKNEMDQAQKNMLYRSGIGHIFAVSGIHLVILTSVVGFILAKLLGKQRIYAVIMLVMTWSFVIFAGMSVSVVRSAIMMSIVYIGCFFMRRGDCANSLGIAGIVICLSDPYCVFSAGFQLSFASAFAAGVIAPFVYHRLSIRCNLKFFVKGIVFSCVESVAIAPLCLFYFGGFSVIAPITNALLIPLCTAALVLCFIVAFTGGAAFIAKPLLWAATMIVKGVIAVVEVISKPSVLFVTGTNIAAVIIVTLICLSVVILLCISKRSVVSAGIMLSGTMLCMLVSNLFTLFSYDKLEFYIFANKKNCAAVVVESDNAVLLDLSNGAKFTSAQMRVIQKCGIRNVSAVFVNNESYYTLSNYKDKIYPKPDVYISGTELVMPMTDAYELGLYDSIKLDNIRVKRVENGFELEYNDKRYTICPDHFITDNGPYYTDGESVYFSTDDETVRRLDYELGVTNYTW